MSNSKFSTKPYKGSRDFYPKEMQIRDWYFQKIRNCLEQFGYSKVDAPLIESLDLYLLKTSEEIINQQLYQFTDKADRKIVIRPEMTPSLARMVAKQFHAMQKPIKWYSIPNLWRYEQPGRGRLREHWQVNVDIFGAPDPFWADVEILTVAVKMLEQFGANHKHFIVKLNHRELTRFFLKDILDIPEANYTAITRILDKKEKISVEVFETLLKNEHLSDKQIGLVHNYLQINNNQVNLLPKFAKCEAVDYMKELISTLNQITQQDHLFQLDTSIIRGFDYYTGLVFEIFDQHPENKRSLFGGGRYDKLVYQIGHKECNAVGFGMGDVTFQNFLESNHLLPQLSNQTQVYIASFPGTESYIQANHLAMYLREQGLYVYLPLGRHKISKQFKEANERNIPFIVLQGENEKKQNMVVIKDMKNEQQTTLPLDNLVSHIKNLIASPS